MFCTDSSTRRHQRQQRTSDGTGHSGQTRTLSATCSGYGQIHQLKITFQRLSLDGFTATISDPTGTG